MILSGDYEFSLSGLKTAVINHIRYARAAGRQIDIADLAASFQQAVIDVQVAKAGVRCHETGATAFCLPGASRPTPRCARRCRAAIEPLGIHVSVPPLEPVHRQRRHDRGGGALSLPARGAFGSRHRRGARACVLDIIGLVRIRVWVCDYI